MLLTHQRRYFILTRDRHKQQQKVIQLDVNFKELKLELPQNKLKGRNIRISSIKDITVKHCLFVCACIRLRDSYMWKNLATL